MKVSQRPFILYYLVLLVFLVLRTSEYAPNILLRTGYLAAFFVPFLFAPNKLFPPILISFMTIGTHGFAFNYLPYEISIYFALTFMIFIARQVKCKRIQISVVYIYTLIFLLFRNILDSFDPQNIFYCTAIIGMFSLFVDKESPRNMLYAFVIVAIALSLLYLTNYDKFIEDYNAQEGLERSGWIDPNYFSCILGMGVMASLILMIKYSENLATKILLILTILFSFISQVILASRGGVLAISVGGLILLVMSKIKIQNKILAGILIVILINWMYTSGYFQLLEYRIQVDAGGGSGRMDIWAAKLKAFFHEGNIMHWIFGFGYVSGFELTGTEGNAVGFHNDIIAVLCEYGIIGLMLFLYWFCYPFFRSSKENKPIVFAMLSYLLIVCATLEPLSSGTLPYFAFYFAILLISKQDLLNESTSLMVSGMKYQN